MSYFNVILTSVFKEKYLFQIVAKFFVSKIG